MKRIKLLGLIVLSTVLFYNCTPEDYKLENTISVDEITLSATGTPSGGNKITLKMETPGVTGMWDYNVGVSTANEVTFVYPIFGTSTFTYKGTLGAEFFEKTIEYTVDQITDPIPEEWNLLAGNTINGKNWVFDGTPGDGGLWWYMVPPYDPSAWQDVWWNAGGTCCPPADVDGKMHFNLNGSANYIYYESPTAQGQPAKFSLDVTNQTLKIIGGNILGSEDPRGNPDGVYTIIELTEESLILYAHTNPGGTGWVWKFRKE